MYLIVGANTLFVDIELFDCEEFHKTIKYLRELRYVQD
jgi:hypothetical protein